jgi:hypothetical protein
VGVVPARGELDIAAAAVFALIEVDVEIDVGDAARNDQRAVAIMIDARGEPARGHDLHHLLRRDAVRAHRGGEDWRRSRQQKREERPQQHTVHR